MMAYGGQAASNDNWKWALGGAIFAFFLTLPAWFKEIYYLHALVNIFLHSMVALGLRLLWRTGLVSFGTAGFIAIGGYAAGLLSKDMGVSFWLSLPVGGLAAAAVGVLIGIPTLRLKSSYFFLISWATGEIIRLSFLYLFIPVFGGWQGFRKIPLPDAINIPGLWNIDFTEKAHWYYLAFFLLCLTVVIMTRIDNSRVGITVGALQDAPDLCESVGVPTMQYRVFAFAAACFFAGVSGAVYGSFNTFLHPESFTIIQSIETVSFVIIGGSLAVWGPILGVFVVKGIAMLVRGLGAYEIIVAGSMMILVMLFIPEGLSGIPRRIRRYLNRRKVDEQMEKADGD
jgi:branched-chain amino acid transport system permease protein